MWVANPGEAISELWPLLVILAALVLPFDIGVRRIALPLRDILVKMISTLRTRKAAEVQPTVVVDRLQQAKRRVQRDLPVGDAQATQVERTEAAPKREPVATNSSKPGATSNALLEARRKRKEDK